MEWRTQTNQEKCQPIYLRPFRLALSVKGTAKPSSAHLKHMPKIRWKRMDNSATRGGNISLSIKSSGEKKL